MSGFPKRRLIQTLAVEDVEKTAPVNLNYLLWRNPENIKIAKPENKPYRRSKKHQNRFI